MRAESTNVQCGDFGPKMQFYALYFLILFGLSAGEQEEYEFDDDYLDIQSLGNSSIILSMPEHGDSWNYPHQESWPKSHKICGDKSQSPINIVTMKAKKDKSMTIKFANYKKPLKKAFVENNGHTVQISFSDTVRLLITGNIIDNKIYRFAQMHFHWGKHNFKGSEHREAVDKPDGLAVLGIFFRITKKDNSALDPIINLVSKVPAYTDNVHIDEEVNFHKFLPAVTKPFYTYKGSLTTPPCFESVTWIVFKIPVGISQKQMNLFRTRRSEAKDKSGKHKFLVNNNRKIQSLNGRVVKVSGP